MRLTRRGVALGAAMLAVPGCASVERLDSVARYSGRTVRVDAARLATIWDQDDPAPFEAAALPAFADCLLVAHRSQLRLRATRRGVTPDTSFNVKSVSKSVLSLLVGTAIADGAIESVRQSVAVWFPGARNGWRDVELRHLLTMTAGFRFVENSASGNRIYTGSDWTRNILRLEIDETPGSRFLYATPAAHLVSAIVEHATDMGLADYARTRLFDPLGVTLRGWTKSPEGAAMGGSDMLLSPLDLLTIGQLVLNEGHWQGRQLVPEEWVQYSTRPHWSFPPGQVWSGYGLFWWTAAIGSDRAIIAEGWGGQFILILPARDAVVVLNARTGLRDQLFGVDMAARRRAFTDFVSLRVLPLLV